jgi:hypothetical protein
MGLLLSVPASPQCQRVAWRHTSFPAQTRQARYHRGAIGRSKLQRLLTHSPTWSAGLLAQRAIPDLRPQADECRIVARGTSNQSRLFTAGPA